MSQHDNNKDGYLEGFEALLAIDYVIPDIDDAHIEYIYRVRNFLISFLRILCLVRLYKVTLQKNIKHKAF